jgi:FkbM family methyltransferase
MDRTEPSPHDAVMRRWLIQRYLERRGLTVAPFNGPYLKPALQRLQRRNIAINTVVDVGASDGQWSREMLKVYPNARYLCIEAQGAHEAALRSFVRHSPNVEYVISAAGATKGEVYFDNRTLFGGAASNKPFEKDCESVPMTTIDFEVNKRNLPPPYLIKLDTHGFESEILAGAERTLSSVDVLVAEVYNFDLGRGALHFHELCSLLAETGFRCIDLFEPMYRPKDEVLWQMDLVFARATRPEFADCTYA